MLFYMHARCCSQHKVKPGAVLEVRQSFVVGVEREYLPAAPRNTQNAHSIQAIAHGCCLVLLACFVARMRNTIRSILLLPTTPFGVGGAGRSPSRSQFAEGGVANSHPNRELCQAHRAAHRRRLIPATT
jgi:hypothetical protein